MIGMPRLGISFVLTALALLTLHCSTTAPDPTHLNRLTDTLAVWGEVQRPVVVQRVLPKYPNIRPRMLGIVIVEVWIREDGSVGDVRALKPLPYGMTEAALEAVRQWRFVPGKINGKPVPVVENVSVNFTL
jgi:TonB family protein